MDEPAKTALFDIHQQAQAKFIDFAGCKMPLQYSQGILAEHLAVRKAAGLFDVSHMGRILFRGTGALGFLRFALTNDAAKLQIGQSQYTFLSNTKGVAIDDAFLYRFTDEEYLLVINAANRDNDLAHLQKLGAAFENVEFADITDTFGMLALQGPQSRDILASLLSDTDLSNCPKGGCITAQLLGQKTLIARTGYTGEPIGYELIVPVDHTAKVWTALVDKGAVPCGLGARDTLRIEAGLPLYGHEQGKTSDGKEIPIFAVPQAQKGVCFEDSKREFHGQKALASQFEVLNAFKNGDFAMKEALPEHILPVAVASPQAARPGDILLIDGEQVGTITSGTVAPYWTFEANAPAEENRHRPVALALLDSQIVPERKLIARVRGRELPARAVFMHVERQGNFLKARIYSE